MSVTFTPSMKDNHHLQSVEHWGPILLDGGALLTVNQRLARHSHRQFQAWRVANGDESWTTPIIMPLNAWFAAIHSTAIIKGCSDQVMLHDLAQMKLWQQCIEHDLDSFRGKGSLGSLLNVDAAATNASKAWAIEHQWQMDVAEDGYLSLDQRAYGRWKKRYRAQCLGSGHIDSATLGVHVRELVAEHAQNLDLPSHIVLAGFVELNPLQSSVLAQTEACSVELTTLPLARSSVENTVSQSLFDSEADELGFVAQRCRELLEKNQVMRIGVVVPNLDQRRGAVVRALDSAFFPAQNPLEIAAQGRPYDVSLGVALSELPPIRSALNSLVLLLRTLESSELSQWLLSPYLTDAQSNRERRTRLDRDLRSQALRRMNAKQLIDVPLLDSDLQKQLKAALKLKVGKHRTMSVFADYFARLLDTLGWPGKALGSEEFQAVEAWRSLLDDMQHLDDGSSLTTTDALRWLVRLVRDRIFQPESDTVPIQVMGRLESHGLHFDELMVVGLDSGNWPPNTSATAFLPFQDQREAGVPESAKERQLDIAKQELNGWATAADRVFFSSVKLRDGQELTRSELLSTIPVQVLDDRNGAASPASLIQAASSGTLSNVMDTHGPTIPNDDTALGGARLFEDQAQCPFRAFALHRLRIRPMEEATLGLDPRAHGNLLHIALEYFWAELKDHAALIALDDAQMKSLLTASINRSLEDNQVSGALQEIERMRLLSLLLEWLNVNERGRIGFQVEAMEKEQLVTYQGFNFTLKVDRIDRLESGERIILDYKTGTNNNPRGWAAERIENPQLPLYAVVTGDIEGVAYAQIAKNASQFKGIASDSALLNGVISKLKLGEEEISDWQGWLDHWRTSLDTIAVELRAGLASVTPTKNACQFCDLPALCRIDDAGDDGLEVGGNVS